MDVSGLRDIFVIAIKSFAYTGIFLLQQQTVEDGLRGFKAFGM